MGGLLTVGCMETGRNVRGERALLLKRVAPVRSREGGIDTFLNALPTLLDVLIFSGGGGKTIKSQFTHIL